MNQRKTVNVLAERKEDMHECLLGNTGKRCLRRAAWFYHSVRLGKKLPPLVVMGPTHTHTQIG